MKQGNLEKTCLSFFGQLVRVLEYYSPITFFREFVRELSCYEEM